MIRATVTCRIYACARLRPGPTGLYAVGFARSREQDGTLQVVRLWTDAPALMESLLWCQAGEEVTVGGSLTACLCVPVGSTEQKPLVDVRIASLEVESSLARWFPPRAA
jgi:hypothetical protein